MLRIKCERPTKNIKHIESNLQRKWRKRILKRDGYKCRYCGDDSDLHLAHLTPRIFRDDNLITLCKKCHMCGHAKKNARYLDKKNKEVLKKRGVVLRKFLGENSENIELLKRKGLVNGRDPLTRENMEFWNNKLSKIRGEDLLTEEELNIMGDGYALIVASKKDTDKRRRGVKRLFNKLKKERGWSSVVNSQIG